MNINNHIGIEVCPTIKTNDPGFYHYKISDPIFSDINENLNDQNSDNNLGTVFPTSKSYSDYRNDNKFRKLSRCAIADFSGFAENNDRTPENDKVAFKKENTSYESNSDIKLRHRSAVEIHINDPNDMNFDTNMNTDMNFDETSYVNDFNHVVWRQTSLNDRRIDVISDSNPFLDSDTKLRAKKMMSELKNGENSAKTLQILKEERKLMFMRKEEEMKKAIDRLHLDYTEEKFLSSIVTHAPKSGLILPEWKRRQLAKKKCDEAIKLEEEKLRKEFEDWKLSHKPIWMRQRSQN